MFPFSNKVFFLTCFNNVQLDNRSLSKQKWSGTNIKSILCPLKILWKFPHRWAESLITSKEECQSHHCSHNNWKFCNQNNHHEITLRVHTMHTEETAATPSMSPSYCYCQWWHCMEMSLRFVLSLKFSRHFANVPDWKKCVKSSNMHQIS